MTFIEFISSPSSSSSSSSTTYALGITSALIGQLLMTIGFYIWDNHWTGSAFALNLFKCNFASIGFLVVTILSNSIRATTTNSTSTDTTNTDYFFDRYNTTAIGYLLLSSTIGIIIGDIVWIQALQLLGAKRVILMDSLKPFLAAFFGWWLLDEILHPATFGGVTLTLIGIVIVSFENVPSSENDTSTSPSSRGTLHSNTKPTSENGDDNNNDTIGTHNLLPDDIIQINTNCGNSNNGNQSTLCIHDTLIPNKGKVTSYKNSNLVKGTIMSIINIVLDTYGAVLIKQHGINMTVWEINLIRFGFAGVVLAFISIMLMLRQYWLRPSSQNSLQQVITVPVATDETTEINNVSVSDKEYETPWFALPISENEMTRSSWSRVCVGTVFVTFLTPLLSSYALFQVALALALTLGSTGPIYSLILSYFMPKNGQPRKLPSTRSVLGTFTAVAGIIILAFYGMVQDDGNR